jgi:chloride channel 7
MDIEDINQSVFANSYNFAEGLSQDNEGFVSNQAECLDYEKTYNLIDLKENDEYYAGTYITHKQMSRWLVMFLVGVVTGLAGVLVDFTVENFADMKYNLIQRKIAECETKRCLWQPLMIWISINCGFALISALLVVFLAPAARGSGIPHVKCYLNGIKIPFVVRFSTLVAKVFGVASAVLGGLACGKEGPMIHTGSIIAAGISQGLSTSLGFDLKVSLLLVDSEVDQYVNFGNRPF